MIRPIPDIKATTPPISNRPAYSPLQFERDDFEHKHGDGQDADSDDCGQRFRLKPDADSDPRRTGIPKIPAGVVVDVGYGVS